MIARRRRRRSRTTRRECADAPRPRAPLVAAAAERSNVTTAKRSTVGPPERRSLSVAPTNAELTTSAGRGRPSCSPATCRPRRLRVGPSPARARLVQRRSPCVTNRSGGVGSASPRPRPRPATHEGVRVCPSDVTCRSGRPLRLFRDERRGLERSRPAIRSSTHAPPAMFALDLWASAARRRAGTRNHLSADPARAAGCRLAVSVSRSGAPSVVPAGAASASA